jgi:hypothetical protein
MSWSSVTPSLNVADYDFVILNFWDPPILGGEPQHPTAEQFARLLFSSGTVIAIGDPTANMGRVLTVDGHASEQSWPVTWWLPVNLPVKKEGGEAIRSIDSDWSFWFGQMDGFEWHFLDQPQPLPPEVDAVRAAQRVLQQATGFDATWEPLAATRFRQPLGVAITVRALSSTMVAVESGPVIWLPQLKELSSHEAVDLLLRKFAGVGAEEPLPSWLSEFRLPREVEADEAIVARRGEAAKSAAALEDAEETASRERRFNKLLYEKGKEILEPIVREALEVLGAKVAPPMREGIEDGRLVDPSGRQAMLEIKGLTGQLGLTDVRQLHGWMWTALDEEGWEGKGIVVANLKLGERPDQRQDLIAPNAKKFAESSEMAVLTSTQLHEALRRDQLGELDRDAFWNAIFRASGQVDLPEPKLDAD